MGLTYIYALCCPDTGEIRYIGKANNPELRLKSHIKDSARRDYPLYRWMRKLSITGKLPVMVVISEESNDSWEQAEREAIKKYRESGANLLNVADGGDQPSISDEQRAKNGKMVAQKIHSDIENKKVWAMKRQASETLKWLESSASTERVERFKDAMRFAAYMRPDDFGKWATI